VFVLGKEFAVCGDMGKQQQTSSTRRDILASCLNEWVNSGYTTLLITVFVVYLRRVIFAAKLRGTTGAVVWAGAVSASMLIRTVVSPILGSLADASSSKRTWLAITAISGGLACFAMALVPQEVVFEY
jgi:UMF1 family MFS transporter